MARAAKGSSVEFCGLSTLTDINPGTRVCAKAFLKQSMRGQNTHNLGKSGQCCHLQGGLPKLHLLFLLLKQREAASPSLPWQFSPCGRSVWKAQHKMILKRHFNNQHRNVFNLDLNFLERFFFFFLSTILTEHIMQTDLWSRKWEDENINLLTSAKLLLAPP